MACGARLGLKQERTTCFTNSWSWLNGLWSPFGFETKKDSHAHGLPCLWLNGLWSPFGFETSQEHSGHGYDSWLNGLWSPFGFETTCDTTVALLSAEEEVSPPPEDSTSRRLR